MSETIPAVPRPVLLDTRAAAYWLQVSPRTLAGWRRRDVGPVWVRFEGKCRYLLSDLEAYVDAKRVTRR
jgi:hypothetical protein